MYRLGSIAIVLTWLVAMTALVVRDVWPAWTAQDPPPLDVDMLASTQQYSQAGIFDGTGHRIGTAWSRLRPFGEHLRMQNAVALRHLRPFPPVRIETSIVFRQAGDIDEFDLDVYGFVDASGEPIDINMRGERYGAYIPCVLEVGPFRRTFKLDAASSLRIADSIRPFDVLPDLHVGQSWRMQLLDPVSAMLNQSARIEGVIAHVVAKETIEHNGQSIECFRVEADRARAWVQPEGNVVRQEVEVPGFGRLRIEEEPYDEQAWLAARREIGETMNGRETRPKNARHPPGS
jgi:hypothetical protein